MTTIKQYVRDWMDKNGPFYHEPMQHWMEKVLADYAASQAESAPLLAMDGDVELALDRAIDQLGRVDESDTVQVRDARKAIFDLFAAQRAASVEAKDRQLAEALTIDYSPHVITWDGLLWAVKALVKKITALSTQPVPDAGVPHIERKPTLMADGSGRTSLKEYETSEFIEYWTRKGTTDLIELFSHFEERYSIDPEFMEKLRANGADIERDAARLDFIENCTVDLRCYSPQMPGCDDADVYWNVIEHHMAEPSEREIGWGNNAREAIDAAMAAQGETGGDHGR